MAAQQPNGAGAPAISRDRVAAARGSFGNVRRTEKRRPSDHLHPACCGFLMFIATPGCFARRGQVRTAGFGRAFRSRARQRKERSIWLLRPPGSFGSGRRQVARQRAISGGGAAVADKLAHTWPSCVRRAEWLGRRHSFRPSCRVSSSSGPAVGCRRAALRVVRNGIALANILSGEGSFEGPSNSALEPSRPPSCAIMSPRRAAQRER